MTMDIATTAATLTAGEVKKALARAGTAMSRSTIEILSGVRFTGDHIECTDMERMVRVPLATGVSGVVSFATVKRAVSACKAGDPVSFSLSAVEDRLLMETPRGTVGIDLMDSADWPVWYHDAEHVYKALPTDPEDLAKAVRDVSAMASRDVLLPVLHGTLLRFRDDGVSVVATDSYRLAVDTVELCAISGEFEALVNPGKALGSSGILSVSAGADVGSVVFQMADDSVVFIRTLQGSFPNWEQFMPGYPEFTARVPDSFVEAIGFVNKLSERLCPVMVTFDEKGCDIDLEQQDGPSVSHRVSLEYVGGKIPGDEVRYGYNPGLLLDGLGFVGSDCCMDVVSPLRPALLRGEGDRRRYILMPVRLAG